MSEPRDLSPEELADALVPLIGALPTWTERREALERLGSRADPWLLAVRDLESAEEGQLGRVLAQDPVSVVTEGWRNGERVAIRALRPAFRRDPVWVRRLGGAEVVIPLGGPPLAALLPAEDPPDSVVLARLLGAGLLGLRALHTAGRRHGGITPEHLVFAPEGVRLAWFDPVLPRERSAAEDLASLGATVARLDPEERDPLGSLARGMAENPPPSVDMAQSLVERALASTLAERRHAARMRNRTVAKGLDRGRLHGAILALATASPPPKGQVCLRAGHDAVMVIAECDGQRLRGGPCAGLPPRFLPTVWDPRNGLDASAARALCRAWVGRRQGNEERRASIQAEIGADDARGEALVRWLNAALQLRTLRLLVEIGAR